MGRFYYSINNCHHQQLVSYLKEKPDFECLPHRVHLGSKADLFHTNSIEF